MKTAKNHLKNNNSFAENVIETFGVFSLALWALLILVTTLLFVFKQQISWINVALAIIIADVFIVYYAVYKFRDYFLVLLVALLIFTSTFFPALIISGNIYDLSYDGQAYHQEAVIQFDHGWNPIYITLENEATANLERWLNHYPKANWIVAASIYELTGNIETGKVLSIYAAFIAFAFCLWASWKLAIPKFFKFIGSLLLALNPVFIYQSLSYYLDGILVSLLLILSAICLRIYLTRDKTLIYPFVFAFAVLVNIKLSAVVFAAFLVGAFILYFWFTSQLRLSLRMFKYLVLGLVIGVMFLGFNPYITNFAQKGNPLYPASGKGALDYVPMNMPENFWNLPPPLRLLGSIFSPSSLARGEGQKTTIKLPFSVSAKELDTFRETNAKTGGFGPLYGGIFALSVVAISIYLLVSKHPKERKISVLYALFFLVGVASMVSLSSVARFVPFIWWIPLVVVYYLSSSRSLIFKTAGIIISGLLIINISLIAYSYFPYNISQSKKLDNQLIVMSTLQKTPLIIDVGQFGSTKIKLEKYNIVYIEVPKNSHCISRKRLLPNNITDLCEMAGGIKLYP